MSLLPGFTNSSIFYVILGVILALLVNQGMAFALSTDMPIVAVESDSMVPTFYKGDILVLQGVPAEQLKVDDIIVFSPPNQDTPVVHRIIGINPDGTFQTKGDANPGQIWYEKSIKASQVHGKQIMIIPLLGWIKIITMEFILPNLVWMILGVALIGLVYVGNRSFRGGI
ncbi:MAG: signal peptidase I [Candidatus Aenigmatarchaeota archaeon]|nr:MAG: signal peptidase I [Candidatus Aenigmarchaeota archaeon]